MKGDKSIGSDDVEKEDEKLGTWEAAIVILACTEVGARSLLAQLQQVCPSPRMWRCGCNHGCPSTWRGRWDVCTHWFTTKAWPFVKRWYWVLIVAALIGLGFWLPTTKGFKSILAWIRNLSIIYSILAFVFIQALLTVLFLPGALFVLMAGFTLGFWLGTLVAWMGSVLGAVGAFLVGRQRTFQAHKSPFSKRPSAKTAEKTPPPIFSILWTLRHTNLKISHICKCLFKTWISPYFEILHSTRSFLPYGENKITKTPFLPLSCAQFQTWCIFSFAGFC